MLANINGKDFNISDNLTIQGLISELKLDLKSTAVAVNKAIIPKSEFNDVRLKENDKIDLVTIAPGGW